MLKYIYRILRCCSFNFLFYRLFCLSFSPLNLLFWY
nr:MAG TPA: hypothetical protein [Bacteriophage sp.]